MEEQHTSEPTCRLLVVRGASLADLLWVVMEAQAAEVDAAQVATTPVAVLVAPAENTEEAEELDIIIPTNPQQSEEMVENMAAVVDLVQVEL